MAPCIQRSVIFAFFIALFFTRIRNSNCGKNTTVLTKMMQDVMKNYDKRIIPSQNGEPVEVHIQVYILDMVPVTRYHMHYSIEIFFRQIWRDYRLKLPMNKSERFSLSSEAFDSLWVPEVQFPMAKKGSIFSLMKPNIGIHIDNDGVILLSRRVSLTLFCPMDLHSFPFDQQTCEVPVQIFSYNNDQCKLVWGMQGNGPIFMPKRLEIFEYQLANITYGKHTVDYGSIGSWDTLWIRVILNRDISYYILQYITPCALIVVLSWVGFWIDYKSTPARSSLGITTVLTITTLTNSIRSSLPNVAYTKAIDIYLIGCFLFVFSSMVEFAIVGVTHVKWQKSFKKRNTKQKNKNGLKESNEKAEINQKTKENATNECINESDEIQNPYEIHDESESNERKKPSKFACNIDEKVENSEEVGISEESSIYRKISCGNFFSKLANQHMKSDTHIIDRKSRFIFPILFLLFNVVFFIICFHLPHDHE